MKRIPQDMIRFVLTDEETITENTIRISVQVAYARTGEQGEQELRKDIHDALNTFIEPGKEEKWNLSAVQRNKGNDGIERLTLNATMRVTEEENHQLEDRCKKVSRPGLQLHTPIVDSSVPLRVIETTAQKLRERMVKTAYDQCISLNTITNREYRVANINFSEEEISKFSNSTKIMAASYAAPPTRGGGEGLGHSQKMTMSAVVDLGVIVDTAH